MNLSQHAINGLLLVLLKYIKAIQMVFPSS